MSELSFRPGRNCWRVADARCFSFIIDGQDYFRALRQAFLGAERFALMVGWDFDFEIEMLPGESDDEGLAPDGFPNRVGPFLEALVEAREGLDIYLLKWSGGALVAPGRVLPGAKMKLLAPGQIHLAFDGRHPIGACHHQKIAVFDDSLAFCGGIDMTDGRWDRPAHRHEDPRRLSRDGTPAPPWHDASAVISGPAAAELSRLARERWLRANDEPLRETFSPGADLWPKSISPDLSDVPLAIARTEPPQSDQPTIAEIEQLYLDAIASAKEHIYLESQYFCADSIARAIARRLSEPDGPEIVLVNPIAAYGAIEDQAMHITRSRMVRAMRELDRHDRFRILYPMNEAEDPIYVHAKICIVDDRLLRVGSSNLDRRSMGFDTECDVAIAGDTPRSRDFIATLRNRLLAEHLGSEPSKVADVLAKTGSLIEVIETLNPREGRGLRELPLRRENLIGALLADTRFFDPRYRRSARARLGLTSRHVMLGAAAVVLAGGLFLRRRVRRP
ncbi:phospholipase D-like domain-containing protein [Paracoccus ravus]|uniref:phospholipase D-like domain-containing protein n=1 Tax=Paracoccus ravus TaxID=2447760 RepID=UPI00106E555A|nr:phospholipase D-like domain-containing protein [Paracoccus ravus]